ncbi:MAG: HDIG domain-containing protein [Akkermansiaceae bacterium]|nr:HDIG domain-containing protein [Akkermansiaceae bacterium]MDP4648111.1 HDIG domain-containing protein [Akkermansiaceae bacterium]MDP4720807.1 HDIG domain-containing protein [Akkermansiaceae bacterium]MDP4780619.1 HDIG domain-containing protein [Akkermansiaceae bacterium]MDP4848500.1 HDIG domain-containing protein [Akkermansiaceae bacterium]
MGFLDIIKRWRLAQKGFSLAKKRRVHGESATIQTLEDSLFIKLALYLTFAVASAVLVLKASATATFAGDPFEGMLYGFALALTALAMFHTGHQNLCRRNSRVILVLGGLIGQLLIVRLIMVLADAGSIRESYRFLFVPFALAPMLHGILLGRTVGGFSAVYVSLIGALLVPAGDVMNFLIVSLVCGMVGVLTTDCVRRRVQLIRAGIYVGVVTVLLAIVLGKMGAMSVFGPKSMEHFQIIGTGAGIAFVTALATAMLISGVLPMFEGAFHLTTDISWLELTDLNHKLLKRMQLEAPGTFHHSLVVASLSEAAAEEIGANASMCRVCAYFHDVGKLKKPGYFIENQHDGGENPHDSLTPTMSALIITAHVKDGIDLAVKHKLNPRIIDVIQEHHGDSLVYYFYRKAQEQKKAEMEKVDRRLENPEDLPKVEEKNFRYPGPRPRTKESGIICMADTIESASRTLRKPTPAKIRALIDELVRAKISDGQLDDCPLTLGELAMVKDSFSKTLRSMLHSRIDYQKPPEEKASNGGTRRDSTQGREPEAKTGRLTTAEERSN